MSRNLERMINTFCEAVACTTMEVCVDTHPGGFRNTNELALFPQSIPFYASHAGAEDTSWGAGAANSISLERPGKFPFSEGRADPSWIRQTVENNGFHALRGLLNSGESVRTYPVSALVSHT